MFKKGPICPLLNGACVESKCMFWTHVRGASPQGGDVDMQDCAVKWIPMLLIENSKVERETGAAVESFRNEMVKANGVSLTLQAKAQGLIK